MNVYLALRGNFAIMKKTNYIAPQSDMISVAVEMNICSPAGDMNSKVSNPFSGSSVPTQEEEW